MASAGNSGLRFFYVALVALLLSCAIAGSSHAQSTQPTLTVDLRAVATNSGIIVDNKQVTFTGGAGGIVIMDVYAVLTGYSDPTNLNFTDYLHGSFLSSFGGLAGDLKAQLTSDYNDFIAGNGFQVDLDSDGDIDVGSNNDSSLSGFFRAYHRKDAPLVPEAKIATLTWTRTGGGEQALINFRPRNAPDAAGWASDGEVYDPTNGVFQGGAPVFIASVPEPTSTPIAILALALLSKVRRRTLLDRRSACRAVDTDF